jgi:hypothetical protein
MFVVEPVRQRYELFVPPVIAGLVSADQQDRTASGIKSVKNPLRLSRMLDDELFHVGVLR